MTSTTQVTNVPVTGNVGYIPEHQTTQQDFGNVRQHAVPSSGAATGMYAPEELNSQPPFRAYGDRRAEPVWPNVQPQQARQDNVGAHFQAQRQSNFDRPSTQPPMESRHQQPTSNYGMGRSLQKEINYIICRKNTDDLKVFGGRISDFEKWSTKIIEHIGQSCHRYKGLIENVRKSLHPFTKQGLMNSQVDGFNCRETALELGTLTMKYLHNDLCDNKFTLCGGEELNGFELWRNLEQYYGGSGKEVEVTGLTKFMSFPVQDRG